MKKIFRPVAACLAVLRTCTAFAGCFGGNKNAPEKEIVDNVYKYETKDLFTTDRPERSDGDTFNGDTYVSVRSIDKNGYLCTVQKVSANDETESLVAHMGTFESDETVQIPLNVYENEDSYRGINNLIRLPDGILACVYENVRVKNGKDEYYETNYYIDIYNLDGSLRTSLKLADLFGADVTNSENSYFGINSVYYGAGDMFMTVYGSDESFEGKIFRFGLDGTDKGALEILPEGTDGYIQSVRFLGDDKIMAALETYGETYMQKLVTIDLATGERSETDVSDNYEIMYRSFVGADGGLYYASESGIYSYDLATGENTLLMDFINSDYIYEYGNFFAISKDKFVSLDSSYEDDEIAVTMTTFDKVPDSEIVPKYLITVASAGNAYSFRNQIIEFNLASDEYRIKYIDYSEYNTDDDSEAGEKKLQNDIIAGNVPDVLITDAQFSASKYFNKGLFADMYTFMDSDTELTRDKFLDNVLSACETDGKLYELPTNISIMGFMGHADKINEYRGLTMREFVNKVASLPEGVSFLRSDDYSRDDLLEVMFFINYADYLNPATGLCSLNNDDFKATLEWLKAQPEKSRWSQDDYNWETFDYDAYDNMFKDGKAIAQWMSLSSFLDFENYSYYFGENEVDFVGAPAPDGDGMVFSATNLKFLISSKGNFPEEAWKFVKVFFTEENQRSLSWGFPVTKEALEADKQEALDTIAKREASENDAQDKVVGGSSGVISSDGIIYEEVYPQTARKSTREDVERIYNYVTSAKKQLKYDESILDIIKEEASEYFGGKKSIDDVAAQAESRVNIKLGEQM